jgi:hypothetical protein
MAAAVLASALAVTPAQAQLNSQHVKGLVGLKAGSQPPPHVYVIAPVVYVYQTDTVRTADGRKLPFDADLTSVAYGAGISVVTSKKFLGGNYGYQILFPLWANNRIQGTEIDANPGNGLTDGLFSPLSLGWHYKRADVLAGYALVAPTGRYTDGASDNTGFGMWMHEFSLGTTVYLDEAKKFHAATLWSIDIQSKKEDSETKVGNSMNLEGGVGADFIQGGLSVGLVYYYSFKLQRDQIDGFPNILIRGKNKVLALGPEVSLALARNGVLYGFLKTNVQWETYARTNTQGAEWNVMLTFLVKPLHLQKP